MSTSTLEALATAVTFDASNFWVQLSDGRKIGIPLAYFPRLAKASPAARKKYIISGGGVGLHWEDLDEDISVPALLAGRFDRTVQAKSREKKAA